MSPIRIAVIGIGKIARDEHLPSIARDARFALAAVVSGSGAAVDGVPTFRTAAEAYDALPDLKAVAISTPPGPRTALAREALDRGLDVMLEKPPTPTVGELRALALQAEARGRVLFTTWHSQYNAAVEAMRERLAGRKLRRLAITWKEDVRRWHPGQAWIWEPAGFGVFDPGINALSILTRVMPKPVFVASARLVTPSNKAMPIAAAIRFASPALAAGGELTADFDWRQTGDQTWEIAAETADGTALALGGGGTRLAVDGEGRGGGAPRRIRPDLRALRRPRRDPPKPRRHGALRARRRRLPGRPPRGDGAVRGLIVPTADPAPDGQPRRRGAVALAMVLAGLAGWVDAVGFVHWHGLYVSFMSGNTTQTAAAIGADWGTVAGSGGAVVVFVAGVCLGELIGTACGGWRRAGVLAVEPRCSGRASGRASRPPANPSRRRCWGWRWGCRTLRCTRPTASAAR